MNDSLILGDSKGSLQLFDYRLSQSDKVKKPFQLVKTQHHERIMSIYYNAQSIFTTSKDSFINKYAFQKPEQQRHFNDFELGYASSQYSDISCVSGETDAA